MGWYYNPIQQQKKDQAVAERERQKTAQRQTKQAEIEKKKREKEERKRNQAVKKDQTQENEQDNEKQAIMPRSIGAPAPRRVPVPESFTSAHTSTQHKIAPPARKTKEDDVLVPVGGGTENIAGKTPSPPVKTSKQQDTATFLRGLFPPGPARETAREWMREGRNIRFYRAQKNWFMQLDNRHISVDEFLRIVQKDAENKPRALRTINRLSTKTGPTEDNE
jgi:hypothetical protein